MIANHNSRHVVDETLPIEPEPRSLADVAADAGIPIEAFRRLREGDPAAQTQVAQRIQRSVLIMHAIRSRRRLWIGGLMAALCVGIAALARYRSREQATLPAIQPETRQAARVALAPEPLKAHSEQARATAAITAQAATSSTETSSTETSSTDAAPTHAVPMTTAAPRKKTKKKRRTSKKQAPKRGIGSETTKQGPTAPSPSASASTPYMPWGKVNLQ